jgi:hypothetical protein
MKIMNRPKAIDPSYTMPRREQLDEEFKENLRCFELNKNPTSKIENFHKKCVRF